MIVSCQLRFAYGRPHNAAYNQSLVGNISHILDNLLRNYNKHFRPGFPGYSSLNNQLMTQESISILIGPPLEVTVDVNVLSMGPVSEVDMVMRMNVCVFFIFLYHCFHIFQGVPARLLLPSVLD